MRTSILVFALTATTACSHQQMYNALQHNQRLDCDKQPGDLYQECLTSLEPDFAEYQRQQQQVMTGPLPGI